jgi:protein required for attachment to host cells
VHRVRYAVDDHRERHLAEMDRQFVRQVIDQLDGLIERTGAGELIVAASPHMLGLFRAQSHRLTRRDLRIVEHDRDLAHLSPARIYEQLVAQGFVPPRSPLEPPER